MELDEIFQTLLDLDDFSDSGKSAERGSKDMSKDIECGICLHASDHHKWLPSRCREIAVIVAVN